MTSERARPECDVRSRNALAAGTEQGSDSVDIKCPSLKIHLNFHFFF